ncbi:uncharacterized protein LOC113161871 [Anabas testudineus]|uniref:uncharacterized protein LOC113161871 n=1 Tax=Anabas testudineus TaxID=64144 RepID=UPI00143D4C64|nr:uncharacterized protein LOC113161871 [Anabas testudineus]
MQCPYPPQHGTNRKFLCKGDHHRNCTDMVTSQNSSGQSDVRFTLLDDVSSSSFSVTITELKAGDAGTYWCGSDSQWTFGNYTKIQLSLDVVVFNPVVFIVPAALKFILLFVLVVTCKYKCHKAQEIIVRKEFFIDLRLPYSAVRGEQVDAEIIHVFGYEGKEAKVSCSYDEGYESYEKYLCRNDCGSDDDVLIRTTQAQKNRYSISDDKHKRVFTATISYLNQNDAGKYWCGVTRSGNDYYPAEVKLKVEKDTCCDSFTKVQDPVCICDKLAAVLKHTLMKTVMLHFSYVVLLLLLCVNDEAIVIR